MNAPDAPKGEDLIIARVPNNQQPQQQPQQPHQPQQHQPQPQPQQQQQPQQQHQPQHQPQNPRTYPPTARTYPPQAAQFGPPAGTYYPEAYQHPHPSTYYRAQAGPYHAHPAQAYYQPGPWAAQATYNPTQGAQQLSNMVSTQPQTNVLQHNKSSSSQLFNPIGLAPVHNHGPSPSAINMPYQPMAQTGANASAISASTNTTTTTTTRKKVMAVLRDPKTKEEVPLADTTTPTTKPAQTTNTTTTTATTTTTSSTTTTTTTGAKIAPSAAPTTTTTTEPQTNPLTTTNTASTVDHVHTLLQKVSEDNSTKTGTTTKPEESPRSNKITTITSKTPTKPATPTQTSAKFTPPAPVQSTTATLNGRSQHDKKEDIKPVDTNSASVELNSNKLENSVTAVKEKTSVLKDGEASVANKEAKVPEVKKEDGAKEAITTTTASKEEDSIGSEKKTSAVKQDDTNSVPKEEISVSNEEALKVSNEEASDSLNKANTEEVAKENEDGKENDENKDPLSQLEYEPLQYNPISNREGKKVYSRQFLLDVCEKVCKLDVFSTKPDDKIGMDGNLLQNAFSEKIDMFAPSFAGNQRFTPTNRQNDASRRQNQHNYTGRSSAGQEKQRKIITSVSLTQEVELKTSSNPWRPGKEIKEDVPNDEKTDTEILKKRFRSILNKLTPNNFASLAESVNELNIDTESKLSEVIDIIFAKALAEPGYCVLYGQMCSHLKKNTVGTANFGNTLLRRCQHQFGLDTYSGLNLSERKERIEKEEDPEMKKHLNEELYEDMFRCRMRGLGLIKFIGELYKIEMLNEQIMFECVIRLLSDTSEESLECLCDLLATIGEKLDRSSQRNVAEKEKKSSKNAPKAGAYQGNRTVASVVAAGNVQQKTADQKGTATGASITTLDHVFEQIHRIRKNKDLPLSARIRFKLLDTTDLREKDNWRSKTKDNNPQTLEEIREQHKEKLEQERRQAQNVMGPRRSQEGGVGGGGGSGGGGVGGGRRGLGHSGGSSNQISSLAGNESAGGRGLHTSASSHLLRDHSLGDIKSNHEDFETHKEHQRRLEGLKSLTVLTGGNKLSGASEALRPNSALTLRPLARTEK